MKKISSFIIIILVILSSFAFVACGEKKPEIADNTQYYDEITSTLKLQKSYEGKSFLTEGIGSATLDAHTDGDTTRFKLAQGDVISIRYYQIDTPESTGSVQKWGKAASLFTKMRLSSATEIVLEATATRAEKDSYGTRYLGYVWYKTAEDSNFKCLNLELVENGFSANMGMATSKYPYNEHFAKANAFARKIQLRIYSELEDPLYSDEPEDITLKQFVENPEAYFNADMGLDAGIGSKVRFTACLCDLRVSNSGTHTFVAEYYDEEGTRYTLDVYAAYTSSPASGMPLGHLYRIVGVIQYYGGRFQVSDVKYSVIYGANNPKVYTAPVQKDYLLTFDSSEEFISQYSDTLYTNATVVSSSVEDGVLTIVANAQQRTTDGVKEEVKQFTFKVEVGESFTNDFTAGKQFSVKGYQYVKDSGEITVLALANIQLK
ncbi:MAG: thermonuclease family protein [Clostridia bacterium]|nr:thermonuclease family protein [Clostridia bacterium]